MKRIIMIISIIAFTAVSSESFNPVKESAISLALPGMGLQRTGNRAGSMAFAASEGVFLISSAVTFITYNQYENNSLDFASLSLGCNISQYPGELLSRIEYYRSSAEYNTSLYSKARDLYPDSPDKQEEYVSEYTVPDSLSWEWDSAETMEHFYDMRNSYRLFRQLFYYSLTGIAVNHITSAVFTFLNVNSKIRDNINTSLMLAPDNLVFNIDMRF
ncbi:MAG: hypothetical protein R6U31_04650 [bacterium]